jgi:uncharacterized protein YukE
MKQFDITYNELNKNLRQLKHELTSLAPNTKEFIKKMEQLKRVEAKLLRMKNEIQISHN